MCALARPQPSALVIALTQRLAEDYPQVPLPEVARVVKRAAAASLTLDETVPAEQLQTVLEAVEDRARQTLRGRNSARSRSTSQRP